MQVVDKDGNIFGAGLQVTGTNGKPKTTGGGSVTPAALTKVDDTNVTLTLGGSPSTALLQATSLTLGWTGTLADSRIASAAAWNAKQGAITLTTTGTSGPATLVGSTLNIPQYSGGGSSAVTNLGIGTTGTIVTGTTANTITQSILIPANTLAANSTLDLLARFSKTGSVGGGNYRVYINTSNSLTGATLIATLYQIAGGAVITNHQNIRSFFYNGTNLTGSLSATTISVTDIQQTTSTPISFAYNSATAYYLIFAIQLTSTADSSVMTAYRILEYA